MGRGPALPYTPEERKAARKLARTRWVRNNKGRASAIRDAWRAANPERIKEQYQRRKQKQIARAVVFKLKRFGMTPADYEQQLKKQQGVCAICRHASRIRLAIDHCHQSGKVRGLLCGSCNRGIGLLKDNPNILVSAAKYLLEAQASDLHPQLS